MFNVAVLKMKDIIKFFIGIIFVLLFIYISRHFYGKISKKIITKELSNGTKALAQNNMIQCLDEIIPTMSIVNNEETEEKNETKKQNLLESMLKEELSSIKAMEIMDEDESEQEDIASSINNINTKDKEEKVEIAKTRTKNRNNN